MKIQVDVQPTKKDYIGFQKYNSVKSIWIYVLILILIGLLTYMLIKSNQATGEMNQFYLLLVILASAGFLFVLGRNVVKIVKAVKKASSKPVFSYTFSNGGIHCQSNGKSFDLTWDKIYKVVEKKDMFLVYLNTEAAFIIPKRCFTSDGDIKEFSEKLLFEPRKNSSKAKK